MLKSKTRSGQPRLVLTKEVVQHIRHVLKDGLRDVAGGAVAWSDISRCCPDPF